MRITVELIGGAWDKLILEGDTDVFDKLLSYEGGHKRLSAIGFWLRSWHYAGYSGSNHKSHVFIPWTSCLKIETKTDKLSLHRLSKRE